MSTATIYCWSPSSADAIITTMSKLVAEQTEAFGKRLRLLRDACGYSSQEAFAAALGIEKGTLGQYERGRSYPKPDVLGRIRQLTGASIDWLYLGDESGLPLALHQKIRDYLSQEG